MPSPRSSRRSIAPLRRTPVAHTDSGVVLADVVLTVFRLNGALLAAADEISAPAGLTAARWQVLGAIPDGPLSVADIARQMGLSRQGVQRLANVLVHEGFAEYADNPAHRRAKLVYLTRAGRAAIQRLANRQHVWANAISEPIAVAQLQACARTLHSLVVRVEAGEVLG